MLIKFSSDWKVFNIVVQFLHYTYYAKLLLVYFFI